MKKIKYKLFRIFSYPFNNGLGQKFLFKMHQIIGFSMGYGCVDLSNNSGELPVLKSIIKKSINKDNMFRFIDVGANLGDFIDYTILYSKKFNKKLFADAFEPNTFCFKLLKNKYANSKNIRLNNYAVSDSMKEKVLYYDSDYSGSSSLVKSSSHQNDYKEMKIKNIIFEYGGQGVSSRVFFSDIYNFFTKNKYDLFRITPHGYLVKLNSWLPEYEFPKATNFLARFSINK